MSRIEIAEKKWEARTLAGARKWAEMVRAAESLDAFVKGVAAFTGLSESEVRSALPTKHWADFQASPEKYLPMFLDGVKRAASTRKWSRRYIAAFRTPG